MIKANELRVGNIVNIIAIDQNIVIKSISEVDNLAGLFTWLEKNEEYEDSLTAIEPIPLSSDVLLRCGFIDPAGNSFGCRLEVNTVDELCWYRQDNSLRYQTKLDGFTRDFNIKNLHQLQNLYFALTGKELEINL